MNQCYISKLPPELTDMVIDYLHDDRPALSACSTVSSSWLPAARYHLFDSMRVTGLQGEGDFKDFRDFLQSPRARLCRVLHLQLIGYGPSGIRYSTVQVDIGMLTSILDTMRDLLYLELNGVYISSGEASRHSFQLARLVITCLRASSIDSFLGIFKLFSEVRELQIVSPRIEVRSDSLNRLQSLVPVPHDLKVESFFLQDHDDTLLFPTFHRMFSMESLQSIDTYWQSSKEMEAFGALLRSAGPHLHSLKFVVYGLEKHRLGDDPWEQWSILNIHPCTSLRTLHVGICDAYVSIHDVFMFFENALDIIHESSHTLEYLTLEFCSPYELQGAKTQMIPMLDELDWEQLDVHCGEERDMLQSVIIIFNGLEDRDCDGIDPFLMDDAVTYFHSKLPLLLEKGVLKFRLNTE